MIKFLVAARGQAEASADADRKNPQKEFRFFFAAVIPRFPVASEKIYIASET